MTPIADLWVEKYRPRKISDIVGQAIIKSTIKEYIANGGIPHLFFHSKIPGTGKTTMALCIAYEMLGETISRNFIESNNSDDRSVDKVRVKIVEPTKYLPLIGNLRIILCDEADGLLISAQELLRRPIETARYTRFIFTANDKDALIKPIQSRCAIFEFEPIKPDDIIARLSYIAKAEQLKIDGKIIASIAKECNGDLRAAITSLQQRAYSYHAELEALSKQFKR